ncbi:MAG: methionyl-tRNA formyltransferase [Gammaproteobacteria bacterium]|nr:methionyl-tRNA formyltransferase [Gammaproteobacteria bacterium]
MSKSIMADESLDIIFAGTPEFAAEALRQLLTKGFNVVAVYTQPDRPAGRGRKLTASPVKELALEHGLPVYQPESFKDESAVTELTELKPGLMIVAAYGLLLPPSVLEIPTHGCINIHASLLPRWRGAAPIQRAILAGDAETGITIMQMNEGLDTGAMLHKRVIPINPAESAGALHDRLALLGGEAMLEALDMLRSDSLKPEEQNDDEACYAAKLKKDEAQIDWNRSAEQIARQVAAFNPWPVAQTTWGDKALRIWQAIAVNELAGKTAGEVISANKSGIDVSCGAGVLRITELQMPGKKRVDAASFINAYTISGVTLS